MTTIHWCGTGLSSGPGLRRLLENGHKVVVWNRTVSKAQEVVGTLTKDIRPYSLDALTAALAPGDIAISMLPADQHVAIAKACLAKGANFVSSSYIAPEMRALDPEFKAKGLVSVNEVGLDPRSMGKIRMFKDHTFMDLPSDMPNEIMTALKTVWVQGHQLNISKDKGRPRTDNGGAGRFDKRKKFGRGGGGDFKKKSKGRFRD